MNDIDADQKRQPTRHVAMMTIAALIIALPMGLWFGRALRMAETQGPALNWSDFLAFMIAAILFCSGVVMAIMVAVRRRAAVPADAQEITYLALQAGVVLLAGVMLAVPVAFVMGAGGATDIAWLSMGAIVIAFAVQTLLNITLWKRSDEVLRGAIAESSAASFWLLQGVFFLWACGEKLGLLPAITSWDAVTVLMSIYLLTSAVITVRRGLN